jgi:hypothetical protein
MTAPSDTETARAKRRAASLKRSWEDCRRHIAITVANLNTLSETIEPQALAAAGVDAKPMIKTVGELAAAATRVQLRLENTINQAIAHKLDAAINPTE